MDQDSTKDGAAGGDRRNWRERLGVGQDLPKISDEFGPPRSDAKPVQDENEGEVQAAPRPGTPVARPAPMAPRYARPTPRPSNGSSSGEETQGANHSESAGNNAGSPGLDAWAAPSQPARDPDRDAGPDRESGDEGQATSSTPSPASDAQGPARASAYPQAARPSGAAPVSTGQSFGERLRAQREAAEKLAQQRLAAARERSGRASTEAFTILAPRKAEPAPYGAQQVEPGPSKPTSGEQPRFTFAQEEIVAARQETAFAPGKPAGDQEQQAPDPAPATQARGAPDAGVRKAPPPAPDEPKLYSPPEPQAAAAPEYRHEDDAMFEDEQPTFQAVPPRASAEDYSAAYREFEDEFEEEPRRRSGPLVLLASLAALAVVSGGAIYWYQQAGSNQQLESTPPAAEAANVPVIAAPAEPAKADPPAQEQPQQAAAPTTRKEIYDRIIGEETLEPERIVPTEEAPLREIEQPRASEAGQDSQSGEPLPLPLPPPPGTGIGEQGDLLVPGAANLQTASADPELSLPEPELSLPEPEGAADPGRHPADGGTATAALESASDDAAAEAATSAAIKLRGTAAAPEALEAPVSQRASIYPELTEPLVYPHVSDRSPRPHDRVGEPEATDIAALPERQAEPEPQVAQQETAPVAERVAAPAAEPEAAQAAEAGIEVAEAEPEVAQASDVPLPKAKPEPPVRVTAAPRVPEPPRQTATPSSSGPVQIIPTDQSQAPVARAAQPETQSAPPPWRRTVGREPDPLAGPGSTFESSLSASLDTAPPRQVASVAPDASSQPQPVPTESTTQPTQTDPAGGYLVQLASFRSESDALRAYEILVQRHPQLVGSLDSRVKEASLGQTGSFWRLGVGPLSNRTEATRLCNALIAAGEKDCLVRRN